MPAKYYKKNRLLASLLFLIIIAGILAVYLPALTFPFQYDDTIAILDNPGIRVKGWTWKAWQEALTKAPRSERRPLAQLSFVLSYRAFGINPGGWRAVNILIHLVNTLLVLAIGRSLFRQLGVHDSQAFRASFLGAAIWGLHPIHTQAVTYIVQRMTSMMTLFFLAGVLCFLKARKASGVTSFVLWSGCAAAFLLALGTKENAAVFPFSILLLEIVIRGGFRGGREIKGKHIFFIAAGIFIYVILLWHIYAGGGEIGKGYELREFSMAQRVLTQPRIIFLYLSLLLFPLPSRMAIDWDPAISTGILHPWSTGLAAAGLLVIIFLSVLRLRKGAVWSLAALWFLGTIFLESSFLPLDLVYEHRTYLPTTVPALIAGLGLIRLVLPYREPGSVSTRS